MNNYFPSPFTVWLVQGSVAIPTAIQPGRRTELGVWRCRHPRPRRKSSSPSLPPFFPPCLPPSSPWKRSSFSLWESTKGKKEKELSIKLSRASGAFSRGCHSLWGERGALKTDFKRTVQPSCTEQPPAVPSLWRTCGTERLTDISLCFAFHRSALLLTHGESRVPRCLWGAQWCCPRARPFLGAHSRHHWSGGASGSLLTCQKHQQACKRYFREDVTDTLIPYQGL